MKIEYESASARDAECIYALSKALIDEYEDVQSIDYDKVLSWVRRKIEGNIESYTRIRADGKLVGFYRLSNEEDAVELDDFYLLEEFRGRGIGTQVLTAILEACGRNVKLYVFNKNTGAIHLYEKMGFVTAEYVGRTRRIMVKRI